MDISAAIHPKILNLVPNYFLVIYHVPDCSICKLSNLFLDDYLRKYEKLEEIAEIKGLYLQNILYLNC